MKVKVEEAGPCRKIVRVDVPAETVMPDYDTLLRDYTRLARIPGFRKGKAPASVVEARFATQIVEDARDRMIPRFYREALQQEDITPVAVIGVSDSAFTKNEGLSFNVTVDVAPDFRLPRYKKVTVRSEKQAVADSRVDDTIQNLQRRFAKYEDVTGRPVRKGDLALIDYRGTCDGQPVGELASDCSGLGDATDFWALVDEPAFLPGFPDALVGMNIDEQKEIHIDFAADFHVPAVAGKQGVYTTRVKGIREAVLPDFDEEFLKRFNVTSPDELRQKVREELEDAADQAEKSHVREEISKFLVSKTKLDVPASMVEQETRMMVRDIVQRSTMQGASRELIEEQRAQIMSTAAASSVDRVKLSYILARIAEEESIDVVEEDVDKRIADLSARYGMTPEQFRAELDKRDSVDQLKTDMRNEKTMEFLAEHAKIKR